MNRESGYIKTTIIAGLLVLLPILAVMALIGFIVNTVVSIATSIVGKLPIATFGGFIWVTVFTVFLLVAACFLAGLFVQMRIGRLTQQWVETLGAGLLSAGGTGNQGAGAAGRCVELPDPMGNGIRDFSVSVAGVSKLSDLLMNVIVLLFT
jgi:hypothetical protein